MKNLLARIFPRKTRGAIMGEAAITMPVVLLLTFALVNLAVAGYASVTASEAAQYGARVGSVAQQGAAGAAASAANAMTGRIGVGTYSVSASGGGARGSQIQVAVHWEVPNWFGGIAGLFGGSMSSKFEGSTMTSFRQEGW